jgi:DNA-binding PadR family transcriptional regulator|tara:strand:- start:618 stop:839 length:222 start_codon:yes stop_codon:yes gene_type:complete
MDAFTHTILAMGSIIISYSIGRYIQNNTLHEKVVGWVLDKLEEDGFIQTRLDNSGDKELIKISEIIENHIKGT